MNFKPVFKKKNTLEANYESIEKYMAPINNRITLSPNRNIRQAIDIVLEKRISSALLKMIKTPGGKSF